MKFAEIMKRLLPQRKQRYEEVFGTDAGKWVLADLAKMSGFGQDPQTPGDSHQTAYLVGRSFVVLHILSILNMSHHEMARIIAAQEESERRVMDHPLGLYEEERVA
jgi:hypothetical protein